MVSVLIPKWELMNDASNNNHFHRPQKYTSTHTHIEVQLKHFQIKYINDFKEEYVVSSIHIATSYTKLTNSICICCCDGLQCWVSSSPSYSVPQAIASAAAVRWEIRWCWCFVTLRMNVDNGLAARPHGCNATDIPRLSGYIKAVKLSQPQMRVRKHNKWEDIRMQEKRKLTN